MAFVSTGGRGGSNAVRFRFSHPSGHVTTSSSNDKVWPPLSWTRTSSSGFVREKILLATELNDIVAFESAGLATSCKIF